MEEKTGLILGSIFGASLGKKYPLFPGRGDPGGPLICARFQEEKKKRLKFNKKRRPKQEKGSTVLIIVQIIVDFCLSLFRLLLNFVFHKLMLVIWHALGKARRIHVFDFRKSLRNLFPTPPDQSEQIDFEKWCRLPQRMPRNLDSGAKIGSATCLDTLVEFWPQKIWEFMDPSRKTRLEKWVPWMSFMLKTLAPESS